MAAMPSADMGNMQCLPYHELYPHLRCLNEHLAKSCTPGYTFGAGGLYDLLDLFCLVNAPEASQGIRRLGVFAGAKLVPLSDFPDRHVPSNSLNQNGSSVPRHPAQKTAVERIRTFSVRPGRPLPGDQSTPEGGEGGLWEGRDGALSVASVAGPGSGVGLFHFPPCRAFGLLPPANRALLPTDQFATRAWGSLLRPLTRFSFSLTHDSPHVTIPWGGGAV